MSAPVAMLRAHGAFLIGWNQLFGLVSFELTQTRGMFEHHDDVFGFAVRSTRWAIGLR